MTAGLPSTRPRRRAARARRWAARALLVVPALAVLGFDVVIRRARIVGFDRTDLLFYFGSATLGVVFWTALFAAASRVKGPGRHVVRVVLAVLALVAVGAQVYTYVRYGAYINARAVLVGTSFLPSVGQQLWFDRWGFAAALGPCLALALGVPIVASRLAPLRSRARAWLCLDVALLATLGIAFVSAERGAEQGQPPDVMYVNAMGQLARAHWDHNDTVERLHPGPRKPEPVGTLTPSLPAPVARKNIVFIVTESVRAQSVCLEPSPDCKLTPRANEATPGRLPITQMRALDSTTAISLGVMWTGLAPTASRSDLHTSPLVWEYAAAAGYQGAYYTSQHLLFGNSGTWLEGTPWKRHVSATMLDNEATYEVGADDGKLVDYTLADLDALHEPYFAVVHLSNTHFPYKVDNRHLPFSRGARQRGEEPTILDRYHDSIYLQDIAVGRLLEGLKRRPEAARTVTVFVSDHGEQLREKGSVGHTGTLFDQEVRVPFWIDAPVAALSASERRALEARRTTPVTELDVLPTLLDLMGLWEAPSFARFRPRMPGQSLLREDYEEGRAFVLTNCTELWACAFKNWGAIRGSMKLAATQADRAWTCYDLAKDPAEEQPKPAAECGELADLVETTMGGRPWGGREPGGVTAIR